MTRTYTHCVHCGEALAVPRDVAGRDLYGRALCSVCACCDERGRSPWATAGLWALLVAGLLVAAVAIWAVCGAVWTATALGATTTATTRAPAVACDGDGDARLQPVHAAESLAIVAVAGPDRATTAATRAPRADAIAPAPVADVRGPDDDCDGAGTATTATRARPTDATAPDGAGGEHGLAAASVGAGLRGRVRMAVADAGAPEEAGTGTTLPGGPDDRLHGQGDAGPGARHQGAGASPAHVTACRAALAPLVDWAAARGEAGAAEYRARYATCLRALAVAAEIGADQALVAAVGWAGAGWRLRSRSRGGCCAGPLQCAPRHHCPDGAGGRGGPRWRRWTWHPTAPGVVVSRDGLTCDVVTDCVASLARVRAEERTDEAACGRWSGGPAWREDPKRRRRARWMAGLVRAVRRAVERAADGGPEA